MNFNKSFIGFLLTLLLIVVVIAGFIFIQSGRKSTKKLKPTSTPTTSASFLSNKAKDLKEELTKTDKKIGDLILAENDQFKVTYLISNDQFIVTVKKNPFVDNKKAAEKWFLSKGFKQGDLCFFRINFGPSKEVTYTMSAADTVPTGCDVPAIDGLAPSPEK
jgi:hypothetical protein